MRILCAIFAGMCLLGTVGCDKHVMGICDCTNNSGPHCLNCCAWHAFAPGVQPEHLSTAPSTTVAPAAAPAKIEAIKEMPKIEKKEAPAIPGKVE